MAFSLSPGHVSTCPRVTTPAATSCRSCPSAAPSRRTPSMASWQSTPCSSGFAGQSLDVRYAPSTFRPAQRHRLVTRMASKVYAVTGMIKLALPAGKANPSPPVGPALGAKGVNIMAFCKDYNAATQDKIGTIIPVEITVFEDRSFTFILKTPPASILLKQAAKIQKGSGTPQGPAVGSVTQEQLKEIAETKLPDLNCTDLDAALKIIAGTAKGMGIKVNA